MAQGFSHGFKTRISVLVFLKSSIAPIVLYFDKPYEEYENLSEIFKSQNAVPKLIEKETIGPVKKFAFLSNQIAGIALQEEPLPA